MIHDTHYSPEIVTNIFSTIIDYHGNTVIKMYRYTEPKNIFLAFIRKIHWRLYQKIVAWQWEPVSMWPTNPRAWPAWV